MLNKFIFVHLYNDFSGSPRVLADAIECESIPKKDCCIFTSKHIGFLTNLSVNRVNVFYKRSQSKILQLFYLFFSQLVLFCKLSFLLRKYKKHRFNTYLVVNTMLPFGGYLAGKLFGVTTIAYVHETAIKPFFFKSFLRFFVESCSNYVFFVSNYVMGVEGFRKPEQFVIHNGLRSDFNTLHTTDIDYKHKFANKNILFVASLKDYKGIHQYIAIASNLKRFKFTAALNCEYEDLQAFISDNVIPENLDLLSRPTHLLELYESAYCVMNLSLPDGWVETFGLSILEGMSYGCPVVVPKVGAPKEFVSSSFGLLVDARDTDIIIDFILKLDESFEVWYIKAKNAKEKSLDFSTENYKRNFLKLMKNIIDDNNILK
ncbi:glycosyltransferase [Shewanella sp. H8]|uniref:glycosyltransferase n=1 Tax=Shewanella sp. H8 TaxID=3342676 RepID=UPI003314B3EF